MGEYSELFVAFDVAKKKHAVAIAEGGRRGEIRFVGEIENSPATIERLIKKLAARHDRLHVCFEAGPTGYELYRQIRAMGHDCMVVSPALIPKRAGERVKTNRRDAITLARLHRAGELTSVWVPDATHEAIRDLVRARGSGSLNCRSGIWSDRRLGPHSGEMAVVTTNYWPKRAPRKKRKQPPIANRIVTRRRRCPLRPEHRCAVPRYDVRGTPG